MDVSTLFRACVQTVHQSNQIIDNDTNLKSTFKLRRKQSPFVIKSQAVVNQIAKLREFLLENRPAYLNFSNHLSNKSHMTDNDRDQIDAGAQQIMTKCSQLIKELRREIAETEVSPQNTEHREIMLILIENYLKNVCKIYSEQKAIRVKRAIEYRKVAKLEVDSKKSNSIPIDTNSKEKELDMNKSSMTIPEIDNEMSGTLSFEDELSPEDIQMFESENEQLFNELNTLAEEVKQIETKVVHIAELQEAFTEKVMDQDKDLDRLMTTVVGSTENVKEANEQIRQAIQRNAGLRVWILFFLIVMSFTLLFLDWYNP
ncbi:syntaxin-18 [Leptopilina heterotoma]|uniref:syntaxin-18 n=1 Tax=Leptopilina heterotoma TaxID=63436 RepID=UPI001CA980D5|nr:syntaxin-18 [Leptopilina heterotoma]